MLLVLFVYIFYICRNKKDNKMAKKLEELKDDEMITITLRIPAGEVRAIDKKAIDETSNRTKLIRKTMKDYLKKDS